MSGSVALSRTDRPPRTWTPGRTGGRSRPLHTRFQAGSISKQFLSVVALALAERGRLDLHSSITRWLPHAPAAWRDITLHHLLSSTSGLGHWGDVPGMPSLQQAPPAPEVVERLVERAGLVHPPGTAWRYSGPGFLLAARVLQAATGTPYSELLHRLVLAPARTVATTSGRFPLGEPDVAEGHRRGVPVHVDAGFTALPGTGDLWTTVADLLRYTASLRARELLARPEALWSPYADVPAGTGDPVAKAYGYGTFLGTVAGRRAWFVPGDNPGYRSLLAHLADDGTDLAILSDDEDRDFHDVLADLVHPE
ncbi:serine hydrolase domain-containing protein [Kineococcus sp. SYSU DK003]|uniref:serine hydrolase domain-containing protein n=1 Tax=Kineococcus sp. SYSU DK003 TaxID=3383124 RepID=UPI003D7E5306